MILWIFSKNGRKKLSIKRQISSLKKEVERLRREHEKVKRGFMNNGCEYRNRISPDYEKLEFLQREINSRMDKIRKLEMKLVYFEKSWFWEG